MEIQFDNKRININSHPYKGRIKLSDNETKDAFFFDARLSPTKPLSAYIIYRDDDNSVHILAGAQDLDTIQKTIDYIDDPTEDEIKEKYFPLLMDYVKQNQLPIFDIDENSYIEDNIVQGIVNMLNNTNIKGR